VEDSGDKELITERSLFGFDGERLLLFKYFVGKVVDNGHEVYGKRC
jgi:hypothetical protein